MPIYDHRCDHCGHAFSVVRSFSDPEVEKCPNCGKRPRRLMSKPAIVFKGSGWYKTDSRVTSSVGAPADAGSGGDAGNKGTDKTAGSDAGADTKPAAKASGASEKTSAPSGGG